jgi:hypothetical protein
MAAIEASHPPDAVLRIVNSVLRTLAGLPVVGGAFKDFMVLRFTGRKSGKAFSIPVSAHHLDGDLYAIMEAGWKHNFTDGLPADVVHAGKTTPMTGQLIKDPDAVADIGFRVATCYGAAKAQRVMGFQFDGDTVPPLADWVDAATRLHVAAIKFTPR